MWPTQHVLCSNQDQLQLSRMIMFMETQAHRWNLADATITKSDQVNLTGFLGKAGHTLIYLFIFMATDHTASGCEFTLICSSSIFSFSSLK